MRVAASAGLRKKIVDGILLCGHTQDALDSVEEALEVVRTTDLRRYRRIQKQIVSIIIGDWDTFFNPYQRVCYLNAERAMQGSVSVDIIHEATHGWLFNVGRIETSPTGTPLHEKICCREEARFFKRWLLSNGYGPQEAQSKAESMLNKLLAEIDSSGVRRVGRTFRLTQNRKTGTDAAERGGRRF